MKISLSFIRKMPLLLIVAIAAGSCEGSRLAKGVVVDSQDHAPLDSVLCEVADKNYPRYTDSAGQFNLDGPFGPCTSGCPDMVIRFSRQGYREQTVKNPEGKVTIYLEKE